MLHAHLHGQDGSSNPRRGGKADSLATVMWASATLLSNAAAARSVAGAGTGASASDGGGSGGGGGGGGIDDAHAASDKQILHPYAGQGFPNSSGDSDDGDENPVWITRLLRDMTSVVGAMPAHWFGRAARTQLHQTFHVFEQLHPERPLVSADQLHQLAEAEVGLKQQVLQWKLSGQGKGKVRADAVVSDTQQAVFAELVEIVPDAKLEVILPASRYATTSKHRWPCMRR
jgi:hypothetical protein